MIIDTFANRLKEALRVNNMRAYELSEKTGLDKSLISNYLSGKYKAKQDKLAILGDVLNVNPVWLMGYDVPMELKKEDPFRNEYDEQIEKKAIDLGGKILYIDKDRELTSDDVLNITKQLTEIVEKQKTKTNQNDK